MEYLMKEQVNKLSDKVCLVTGATSGIGEATALGLAELDATVVVVGRNQNKCIQVVEKIKEQTGNNSVSFLVADLSSQNEIRRLAWEFKNHYRRLDVLVNDAGAVYLTRKHSVDGIEMTFALNHLGYFLLTNLFTEMLIASAPARVINVTSSTLKRAMINFEDLENEKRYNGLKAYEQSKLANLLFTYEMSRALKEKGVTVNAVHPGFADSNLGKNNLGIFKPLAPLIHLGGISPQEAACPIVYLATAEEVAEKTGSFFIKERPTAPLDTYYAKVSQNLWSISAALVGI
jgi:NAD(P)-dependent dehydrogenase (short-subunit alcohol dehydrogenase family)